MKPLDPRLLREAAAARRYVFLTTGIGLAATALVVGQALLLARVIAGVAIGGDSFGDVRTDVYALVAIAAARTALAAVQERVAHHSASAVIGQLRTKLLVHATARASMRDHTSDLDGTGLTLLTTTGLDALEGYLTRYLPQLLLAATLTPAILAVIWWHDAIAGLTILCTLPLIPLFMALVGWTSQARADRSLRTLQRLGAQTLDLIAGLPTLRALGRAAGQAARIRAAGEAHRRATMRTLRTAFLSALVLELLTTLSVALVAVGIGLRLVEGGLGLQTGLAVLLLAPEVYIPLRAVGMQFHASVDGIAAAQQAFAILDLPVPERGTVTAPALQRTRISWEEVSVVHDGQVLATPARLTASAGPGEILALTGASGCGKTTAAQVLLGLRRPSAGRVVLRAVAGDSAGDSAWNSAGDGEIDLASVDPDSWWSQIAWAPQHPALIPGTLADNVRLGAPDATAAAVENAAQITGFADVVSQLPEGWSTVVGQGGHGLSAGQRQRLSLTRILLGSQPLVILDEPTAHLDFEAELAIEAVLARLREQGRTIVVIAHRASLAAQADAVVTVTAGSAQRSVADGSVRAESALTSTGLMEPA